MHCRCRHSWFSRLRVNTRAAFRTDFSRIGPGTLLHHPTGANVTRAPDWVVQAIPPNPVEWLYHDLRAAGVSVERIGDCVAPRRAHAAVVDGERAGLAVA